MGLAASVTYEKGDAFDEAAPRRADAETDRGGRIRFVRTLPRQPTRPCLTARPPRRAGERGGWLVYTNQPWHPQIEMIARVLHNRDGAPWIMRRRTQAEMDALVRAAGFEKLSMEIDRWGIFTVSLARKQTTSA